jgi:hypothetical protein
MTTLQERLALQPSPSTMVDLAAWIAAWPAVRGEFEALIEAHERIRPDFHPQWTRGIIEALDTNLHELAHRTLWLEEHLAQRKDVR